MIFTTILIFLDEKCCVNLKTDNPCQTLRVFVSCGNYSLIFVSNFCNLCYNDLEEFLKFLYL